MCGLVVRDFRMEEMSRNRLVVWNVGRRRKVREEVRFWEKVELKSE